MSEPDRERLYYLLPSLYRRLDQAQGEPLRALLRVMEAELQLVVDDIGAMYDNWFIETCDGWVIPYLAQLVGVRDLKDKQQLFSGQRCRIANTIGYRRRKGTLAVLEHIVRDVTGWHTHAVEFSQQLGLTQHMSHVRPGKGACVNLRDAEELVTLNTPFAISAHTADLRSFGPSLATTGKGKFNLPRIGLYIWRLKTYPVTASPAAPVELQAEKGDASAGGCYTFDPLGGETPLFHLPQPVVSVDQQTQPDQVPVRLSRAAFAADLAAYDSADPEDRPNNSRFYGPDRGLLISYWAEEGGSQPSKLVPVKPEEVISRALWDDLPGLSGVAPNIPEGKRVAIDVERGRFAFLRPDWPAQRSHPVVNYTYAFSADLGGGPYERPMPPGSAPEEIFHIYVAKGSQDSTLTRREATGQWQGQASSLGAACRLLNAFYQSPEVAGVSAVVHILDNGVYPEAETLNLQIPPGVSLSLVAADGVRPVIRLGGDLALAYGEPKDATGYRPEQAGCRLTLNGLYVHGKLRIKVSGPAEARVDLALSHCTIMPEGIELELAGPPGQVHLSLDHTIAGPMRLPRSLRKVEVLDSVIDYAPGYALAGLDDDPGPPITLERVTVFGQVKAQRVEYALDVIFTRPITVDDDARGRVRFSYVPPGSEVPTTDHCQPELALAQEEIRLGRPTTQEERKILEHRLRPRFESVQFGGPEYARLSLDCPPEIRTGSHDGGEMGVFNRLRQPQREANIKPSLDEFLPYGLEAGIYYVT